MKPLKLMELKQHLRQKKAHELIEDIAYLFKNNNFVRNYYTASLAGNDQDILDKYKAIIHKELLGAKIDCYSPPKLRLSVAKNVISDYRKVARSDASIADLMLYSVECGVKCTDLFGDLFESFYINMEGMYEKAVQFIVQKKLTKPFNARLKKILHNARHTGWGFHDTPNDIYDVNTRNHC